MTVVIDRVWMVHEGGTKYYQIFEFKSQSDLPITVIHFGRLAGMRTHRPINGGQVQLKSGRKMLALVEAKRKRGYKVVSDESIAHECIERHDPWWVHNFGAAKAHEIQVAMFGASMIADDEPIEEPDNEIMPGAVELPESRPENWGTW